jgi:hypothetical protein
MPTTDTKTLKGYEHILSGLEQNLPPYVVQYNDDGTCQASVMEWVVFGQMEHRNDRSL